MFSALKKSLRPSYNPANLNEVNAVTKRLRNRYQEIKSLSSDINTKKDRLKQLLKEVPVLQRRFKMAVKKAKGSTVRNRLVGAYRNYKKPKAVNAAVGNAVTRVNNVAREANRNVKKMNNVNVNRNDIARPLVVPNNKKV